MTTRGRWIALVITLLIMIALWVSHEDSQTDNPNLKTPQEVLVPTASNETPTADSSKSASASATEQKTSENVAPNHINEVLERFHQCIAMPKGDLPQPAPSTLNTWVQYFQSRLGETVFNSEEWRNTDLQLVNGEKRRIRVEYDMGENEEYVKKLKYSVVGPDNQLIPLSVSTEQSENPTEDFIQTLEREGEVISSEKAFRMYFKDGSELYAVEKNGIIKDLDIGKDSKLFRCTHLDTPKFNCECL